MKMNNTQKLKKEKVTLEGMVESCDELTMGITKETGLDSMGEDADDVEEEDEDADDGGDAAAPLLLWHHPLFICPLLRHLRRLSRKKTL
jgi:hypothetical protein